MHVRRAPRTVLSAVGAVVATTVIVGGGAGPTAATTHSPADTRAARAASPESTSWADSLQDIVRERHASSSRPPISGTIRQRLERTGADPALGSAVSAVVLDAATGRVVYARNPALALMPASNQKLLTAFTALQTMGPDKTFRTEVRANSGLGTLYLVGGGDPALTSAQVKAMAATARTAVNRAGRSSVTLRVDDDLFPAPTNATGWKASYVPGDVAPVRPLVVDGRNLLDTALDAGAVFRNELVRLGITVSSSARGSEPAGTVPVAATTSPSVSTLVARTLSASNNDYAEFLHRQSSRAAGKGATWAAANAQGLSTLQAKGVSTAKVVIQDGSGLSRSDRSSAGSLASLLLAVSRSSAVNTAFYAPASMPSAGASGTLATRFAQPDTTCARGKVRAKTGTLSDVTALSGRVQGVDGRQRIFAIVANGPADLAAARFAIERFATAATGCSPG